MDPVDFPWPRYATTTVRTMKKRSWAQVGSSP